MANKWLGLALVSVVALGCNKAKKEEPGPAGPPAKTDTVVTHDDKEPAKTPKAGKKKKKSSDEGKKSLPKPQHHDPDPASASGAGCGEVIVDGHPMQLECEEDTKLAENDGVDVVPREALDGDPKKAGGMLLPKLVDHREDGTEGPLRHQGRAGACSCFALASGIDHALIRREDKPFQVSSLHLWARYHHRAGATSIGSNFGVPIASEANWPYDQALAC
jgi:hypothetical protein